ncbi:MAG: hypothetical protein NC432_02370 [Roseburia sp.]|nr:hypothetical protein [Roseburia sp.]MCM1097463.1 hypothetical protein [Ruminococcus flavefaciens]
MTDKKLKQALNDIYRAPAPTGKAAFLKRRRRRELGRWELIAVQARYIRRRVWGISLALFLLILRTAVHRTVEASWWGIAAFTPFLALLAVSENGRAPLYRMDELEYSCRIPRRSVLLARMTALGLFHLALLSGLTLLLSVWNTTDFILTGTYLLTPYLLTAALGMDLARRIRGREGLLACGGAAALVSALGPLLINMRPALYHRESLPLWLAALAAAAIAAVVEIRLNLSGTEEVQWN